MLNTFVCIGVDVPVEDIMRAAATGAAAAAAAESSVWAEYELSIAEQQRWHGGDDGDGMPREGGYPT